MGFSWLTERDTALLDDLYRYKYLTGTQIEQMHFPSRNTRNRRLAKLVEKKLIRPFTLLNVPERIFRLRRYGAVVVAAERGVQLEELPFWKEDRKAPKDHYFMRHFLSTNDFRLRIEETYSGGDPELVGWIPEYVGERTEGKGIRKYLTDETRCAIQKTMIRHTPDAVFALRKAGKGALFFVEVDRGTEVVSTPERGVLKMIRFYLGYMAGGGFRRYEHAFSGCEFTGFRLLIATTSTTRVQNMRKAASELPKRVQPGLRMLWATTLDEVLSDPRGVSWNPLLLDDEEKYQLP